MNHEQWLTDGPAGEAAGGITHLEEGTAVDSEFRATAVDPDSGGTAVTPAPMFGGYSGDYAGIKDAWYSSDGYVYDPGGNRIGTH